MFCQMHMWKQTHLRTLVVKRVSRNILSKTTTSFLKTFLYVVFTKDPPPQKKKDASYMDDLRSFGTSIDSMYKTWRGGPLVQI